MPPGGDNPQVQGGAGKGGGMLYGILVVSLTDCVDIRFRKCQNSTKSDDSNGQSSQLRWDASPSVTCF